jgi:hypothetical protein
MSPTQNSPRRWTLDSRLTRLVVALAAGLSNVAVAAGEREEPPLVLYFEVDGKHVPIEIDKPFAPAQLGGAKSATLRLEPWRQFAFGGVQFRYPREFTFEVDTSSPGVSMWTLSGNDAKCMVHRYEGQSNPAEVQKALVDELVKTYGAGATAASPTTLDLAGSKLKGTRLDIQMAGTKLAQSVFSVRAGADVLVFVFQDSPNERGQPTPEWNRMLQMLDGSLKLPRPGPAR